MSEKVQLDVYKCNKCEQHWMSEDGAKKCEESHVIKEHVCCDCGVVLHSCYSRCEDCRLKSIYNKASKYLDVGEYDGPVYDEFKDEYYKDLDDMYEACECNGEEVSDWVVTCNKHTFSIDIMDSIERSSMDMEDFSMDWLVDADELHEFIDEWNAKQTCYSCSPDYKRIIVLKVRTEGKDKNET